MVRLLGTGVNLPVLNFILRGNLRICDPERPSNNTATLKKTRNAMNLGGLGKADRFSHTSLIWY